MRTETAPARHSPALGQLIFPLKDPGNHNLSDHRKRITGLSAMKKTRGEEGEALVPAPFSPTFTRALKVVPEVLSLPGCTHAVHKGWKQWARRVHGTRGQFGV